MRVSLLSFAVVAFLFTAGCSDAPKEEVKKEAPKPPAPITGRQGFQMTYPSARGWASDAVPMRVQGLNLDSVKVETAKAPIWQVTYVSASKGAMRAYTWSTVEEGTNIHKGVFGGAQDSWAGPSGQERSFDSSGVNVDTPEALEKALTKADAYLKKPGQKPVVNFLLQQTTRYNEPVWIVMWGISPGTAEFTVTVGATSGKVLTFDQ
jgi:hypothetical protein